MPVAASDGEEGTYNAYADEEFYSDSDPDLFPDSDGDGDDLINCLNTALVGDYSTSPEPVADPVPHHSGTQLSSLEKLRLEGQEKLGSGLFDEVLAFLLNARRNKASETEIHRKLRTLCGDRMEGCFAVDQIVYAELFEEDRRK